MDTLTRPTHHVIDRPRWARFVEFDCEVCSHHVLKHPVFLMGPTGIVVAGTGCAARLVGWDPANVARYRDIADQNARYLDHRIAIRLADLDAVVDGWAAYPADLEAWRAAGSDPLAQPSPGKAVLGYRWSIREAYEMAGCSDAAAHAAQEIAVLTGQAEGPVNVR